MGFNGVMYAILGHIPIPHFVIVTGSAVRPIFSLAFIAWAPLLAGLHLRVSGGVGAKSARPVLN